MKSDLIKEGISEDNTDNSQIYQLKINNHQDESAIGFKYSRYRESNATDTEVFNNYNLKDNKKNKNNPFSFCGKKFFKQTKLMTWKNYLVFSRNIKPTIFQIFTPVFICLILVILQILVNNFNSSFINKNPIPKNLENLQKCMYPNNCTTVGYGIIANNTNNSQIELINSLMQDLAETNNLQFERDVKLLTIGKTSDFLDYLSNYENKTKYGVLFCIESIEFYNLTIPCTFEYSNETLHLYTVLYNITNAPNGFLTSASLPLPSDLQLLKLKIDVDNAYMKYYSKKRGMTTIPKINASYNTFPVTENRFLQNADVVASSGAFYFFFPPMISFVVILLEIMREKDLKLRRSLIIIGLNHLPFWISWLITGIFLAILSSAMMVITALICQFDVFINSPIPISFSLFFLFNITMQFLAFFLCTILKSQKSAYTVSYGFILIGLVMEIFLSNYSIIYYLYSTDLPAWVGIIKFIFELYPPFNFSKAYSDIANKAASHFDNFEWRWIKGPGYFWSDLFQRITGTMRFDVHYDVPSTAETMGMFFIDIFLYSLLAFYFDHVDESNRGKSYDKIFFLKPSYWFNTRNKKKSALKLSNSDSDNLTNEDTHEDKNRGSSVKTFMNINSNSNIPEKLLNEQIEGLNINEYEDNLQRDQGIKGVLEEKLKVLQSEKGELNLSGLKILGTGKTYDINSTFCKSRKLNALKETYLNVPIGELFTILGHNGAGKSTLINILTGNISPTIGTAKINDADIIEEPDAIEQLIGLCPQHDILWEELTAEEHIQLYARLRDFEEEEIPKIVENKLDDVNLKNQKNLEVKTYSGGMKRRLSILLSTVGKPKVVFLDEPTTGLDPVNKRFIWSMIKKIKLDKAVILTTHSMEEADYLSDRIGVIVEGKFKCIGTPLDLKNSYGGGYLLTFVTDKEHLSFVEEKLKLCMPSCQIIDKSGGCIILNLPFDRLVEMKHFINILNNNYHDKLIQPLKGQIKECGMAYTTLEEIFLKKLSKLYNYSKKLMNNQSGLTSDLYGNIFRMREFLIKDLLLKNNIQHIKQRTVNAKTSLLKPPNIYSIKKPSSPKPFSKSPIKTFIPVFNMQRTSPIKTSPPDIKKTNYKNISVSRFNYQHKVKSIESEKLYQTHKSHVNQFLQFKRRDSFNKSMYIEKENEKFGKKLIRVNSPLSKNRLDESYSKLKEYGNIAKKIKPDKELNIRKINHVKSHLPPLLIRGSSNKKFNLFFKN